MLQTNVVKTVRFKIQLALGCSILIQLGSLEIDIFFLITTIISGQSYAEKNRSIQITKHRMSVENYTFIIIIKKNIKKCIRRLQWKTKMHKSKGKHNDI